MRGGPARPPPPPRCRTTRRRAPTPQPPHPTPRRRPEKLGVGETADRPLAFSLKSKHWADKAESKKEVASGKSKGQVALERATGTGPKKGNRLAAIMQRQLDGAGKARGGVAKAARTKGGAPRAVGRLGPGEAEKLRHAAVEGYRQAKLARMARRGKDVGHLAVGNASTGSMKALLGRAKDLEGG